MIPFKYIYLEDDEEQLTTDIVDSLKSESNELSISLRKPLSFANEIDDLPNQDYDGLLLDLRLDEFSDAEYRAFTLAQEIRTRTSEEGSNWVDVPIVLCSTVLKLERSYTKNLAGQDLFDKKYKKTEEIVDNPEMVAAQLVSLAKGYQVINGLLKNEPNFKLNDLFFLKADELQQIDERLVHFKIGRVAPLPCHEYARFILRELLEKPNALLDEKLILSRLGVDLSSKHKDKLLNNILAEFKYKGPFCEAWQRWWWPLINQWWNRTFADSPNLVNLNAKDRVETINKKLGLKLAPAESIEKGYNKKFWTICEYYQLPLNQFDGYLLDQDYEPFPWQESRYISAKAALSPKSEAKGFFVHQVDKERFERLKKLKK